MKLRNSVFSLLVAFAPIIVAGTPAKADTAGVSFTSPGPTFNNGLGFSLGYSFSTNSPITVTALGYFDPDGLTESHDLGLYDNSGNLLASATTTGAGTQSGFFNFVAITPVTLAAGQTYQVMGNSGLVDPYTFGTNGLAVDPNITFIIAETAGDNVLAFGSDSGFRAGDGGGFFGANFLEGAAAPVVPEPPSIVLLGTALLGAVSVARRKFTRA